MPINLVLPILISFVLLQGAGGGLIEELDATTTRTGYFRLLKTSIEVLGERDADRLNPVLLATEKIEWLVYVSPSYDPARPPGILVFVSSIDWGGIPTDWKPVMEEKNLIWISASNAGSSADTRRRQLPRPDEVASAIDYLDGAELASE